MPLGSALSGLFSLFGNAMQYAQNIQMQDKQNKFNLEMWNKENEYNSPQAQMRRYEDAGLNSALMYGNVTSGNATSAPVQGVAHPPEWSKNMRELAQAFNIVGLKEQIANMKKAEADAKIAQTAAKDAADEYAGKSAIGNDFYIDDRTGRITVSPSFKPDANGIYQHNVNNAAAYYMYQILSDNYRTNSLLLPRANLIGSQKLLNDKRRELIAPQIKYWNFNTEPWRMKTRFWLGPARLGAQIVGSFL